VEVKRRRFPMVAQISVYLDFNLFTVITYIYIYTSQDEARYQAKEVTEDPITQMGFTQVSSFQWAWAL
jgi:hypothetical protein